ncbi:hypothetical protein BWGOE8_37400 [Bacillus mycoides]|uniref:Uncharacterized protein n=1 Tax=Bacillus mycoides TaxID=1405 RepID=A0A1E8B4L6_BACMY|nr:hypothetical protein BWGOE9_38080 [Bacillus mycoides]OFD75091.1 hypothetical protein BWGOE8_37400 [Bacillus mycoides]
MANPCAFRAEVASSKQMNLLSRCNVSIRSSMFFWDGLAKSLGIIFIKSLMIARNILICALVIGIVGLVGIRPALVGKHGLVYLF